ncbi:type II toxin-antitoxin system HipA family toxin [Acidiphilium sp. C61]|uniref:type II toxin-antitoxin system HipA family toxin n=1 Tax=Acidiphilium sp. C61 TaxID=1671485 RepID=UPI00157B1E25|nr:HipA domain-containing protein [Acidiphilium sp. C61]
MAYPDVDLGAPEYIAASGNNRTGDLVFGPDGSGPAVYTPSTAMLDLPQDDDRLGDLIEAAEAVESGIATRSHLARLLQSGADIGGARPKARIMFDGRPCILKMKAADDGVDVQRLEAACLSVARSAGIETPWHTVVEVNGQSALIIERFDRDGEIRVPFTSAATVMEEPPSSYDNTGASYASVSVMARRAGILDCSRDLFRRLLLNCFLNNTDDHLHNHGFIRVGGQWKLSPVFDVVTQRRRALVLRPAKDVSAEANPTTALTAHTAFGIDRDEAQAIHDEVKMAAADFRDWLRHYGANDADISTASSLAPHAVAAETPSRSRNIIDDEPASPEP